MEKVTEAGKPNPTAPPVSAEPPTLSSTSDDEPDLFQDIDMYSDMSGKTIPQKVWHYVKSIRMEPGFLMYMTASVMGNIIASDLQIDRACRINVGYNDTICDGVMSTLVNQLIRIRL